METLIVQTGGGPGRVRELVNHNGEAIGIGRGFTIVVNQLSDSAGSESWLTTMVKPSVSVVGSVTTLF